MKEQSMASTAYDAQIARILASASGLPPAGDEIEAADPCPKCCGSSLTAARSDALNKALATCEPCEGKGAISVARADRWNAGSRLRQARIAERVGLRERARAFGIPPMALSDLEHGRKPAGQRGGQS